jgi:hypothetical protein
MAIHSDKTVNTISRAIRDLEPFSVNGTLSSSKGTGPRGELSGDALKSYETQVLSSSAPYVVYSYRTPIAWHTPENGWTIPAARYSNTTSNHQNHVRVAVSGFYGSYNEL